LYTSRREPRASSDHYHELVEPIMTTREIMLCGPVRTAIGAFNGSLKTVSATELGAVVVRETLRRGGLDAGAIGKRRHGQ
jgi:hypothetical protein